MTLRQSTQPNQAAEADQESNVAAFFNVLADTYNIRYYQAGSVLHYIFNDRQDKAIEGEDFNNKTVLDIGSGTGNLYRRIAEKHRPKMFFAVDISERMLQKNVVPESQRFLGKVYDSDLPIRAFDYIFMLGVTNYLTRREMYKHVLFIGSSLAEDGLAIVSFSNRRSIDNLTRSALMPLVRLRHQTDGGFAQNFSLQSYTVDEIEEFVERNTCLEVKRICYLNHTVFPFNRVFQRMSLRVAAYIEHSVSDPISLGFASSDFLVFLRRGCRLRSGPIPGQKRRLGPCRGRRRLWRLLGRDHRG